MGAPAGVCKMVIGDEGFPYGVSTFRSATAYRTGYQIYPSSRGFKRGTYSETFMLEMRDSSPPNHGNLDRAFI